MRRAAARLVQTLQSEGWPAADLTGLDGEPTLYLALIVPPSRTAAGLKERVEALRGALPLDLSPLDSSPDASHAPEAGR